MSMLALVKEMSAKKAGQLPVDLFAGSGEHGDPLLETDWVPIEERQPVDGGVTDEDELGEIDRHRLAISDIFDETSELKIVEKPGGTGVAYAAPGEAKVERNYQRQGVSDIHKALREGHHRIALVMPTGAGKTFSSKLVLLDPEVRAHLGVEDGRPIRVLWCAHNHRLLAQAEKEIGSDPMIELIPQSAYSRVSDTLFNEDGSPSWDIVIIDECHHEAMRSYQDQLEVLGKRVILGLTATFDRDDGRLIKFSTVVEPITRQEAVERGFLAETDLFTIVDNAGRNKAPLIREILRLYAHEMGQTIIFTGSRADVASVTNWLHGNHYKVASITTQTGVEVDRILQEFERGDIQFLVNCWRLDEGVDVKGCTDVFLGRNFGSLRMINQTIGRGARPDSDCRVWEIVDPIASQYTAKDIVGIPRSHQLIYFDYAAQDFIEEAYHLDGE